MYYMFIELRKSQSSRLRKLPNIAVQFIKGALARPYLEAVEWLLTARGTRLAALPADIRKYVLEPYLWVNQRLCDIPHRDQYLYGVPHGRILWPNGIWMHYRWGVLHRIGGPAVEGPGCLQYYQNDRLIRDSGPRQVAPDRVTISRFGLIREIYVSRSGSSVITLERSLHLRLSPTGNLMIRLRVSKTRRFRIFANRIEPVSGHVFQVIATNMFAELITGLRAFVIEYDVPAVCAREWARAQSEYVLPC